MRSMFGIFAKAVASACAMLAGGVAFGQAVQVLDSVDASGRDAATSTGTVLEMAFRDPLPRPAPFYQLNVAGTAILACQRAADQGLYCLDGTFVRYWSDTKAVPYGDPLPRGELFDCRNPALKLDTKRPNPCTSLTVGLDGALWLAGRKASSHSLLKVVRKSTLTVECSASPSGPGPWYELSTPLGAYCAREYAPGRPILVDTNMIDGELSNGFTGTPGVLGLEERKTVVFFRDDTLSDGTPLAPVEFASGKTGWNLIGNEQILSAALLQYGTEGSKQNYVLVTTTTGRVMAKKASSTGVGTGAAFPVFALQPTECTGTGEQSYRVRVSSQSDRVYIADKFCRRVLALNWITDSGTYPAYCAQSNDFCLINAKERAATGGTPTNATLSTGTTGPDGLSVAPGIGVDLRDCGFNADGTPKTCPWVPDGADRNSPDNLFNAAEVSGVRIESNGKSKMTVFQVRGIPDCRHWSNGPGCSPSLVVAGRLNITELLPQEIKLQYPPYPSPGHLPDLWISEKYRGQENSDGKRTIDLFWTITEPGVQFRDTFRMSFDVGDLTDGIKNGCGGTSSLLGPDVDWNVVVTGSEKYKVVDGVGVNRSNVDDAYVDPTEIKEGYVETLVNDGCSNPDGVSSKRFSYYAYNLEMAPDLPGEKYSDGIYARMVLSLFDDIWTTQKKMVCELYDLYELTDLPDGEVGPVRAPLDSNTTCPNLEQKWFGADDKLQRCITGSTYPRQNEAVNNCQSFLSQLGQYESALNASRRSGWDPANRIGELKSRVKTLRYVFTKHFVPSIPANGFCSLTATGACTE